MKLMTSRQFALYFALFGAEPCSYDYHYCAADPVPYLDGIHMLGRQDEDGNRVGRSDQATSDDGPADPPDQPDQPSQPDNPCE